jgi:transcription initiation protein SPT3
LATRRGVRSISTDDLIFLIRHDKAKVSRLRTFLSWKDVRKNVKDSDDKGGGDAADFAAADDAAGAVAGPADVAAKPKNKRAKVGLAWDVNSFYSIQVPEREDEEDEEEEEQNYATLQRLAAADERTRHMTREEYVFWSECRQASFTYRKSKRFREWAGFGIVTESKPNDDIVDILGFLTFEIVQTLTEEALKVKEREDNEKNRRGGADAGENLKKRKRETGLFDPPEEGRTPIEPRHVREAYRKLQATPQKAVAMLLHEGRIPARLPLVLVSICCHSLFLAVLTKVPSRSECSLLGVILVLLTFTHDSGSLGRYPVLFWLNIFLRMYLRVNTGRLFKETKLGLLVLV